MESKTPTEWPEKCPPAAILLAAGSASRMGRPKQLLELRGMTLLEIALRKAREAGYAPLVVVGGAYRDPLEKLCAEVLPGVGFCYNPDWSTGMGSSISCGLRHLLEIAPDTPGALIYLADQPGVRAGQLEEMRLIWESDHPPYITAFYREKPGAPALFSRTLFPELLQLTGEQGAKSLFTRFPGIRYPLPEAAFDLDTPEEWAKYVAEN
ncbi:MAG: nucleotidyltransferase family protein [Saprospiraceae bacterium]|jgi:molybdenum cofactor cytidylyltransferase